MCTKFSVPGPSGCIPLAIQMSERNSWSVFWQVADLRDVVVVQHDELPPFGLHTRLRLEGLRGWIYGFVEYLKTIICREYVTQLVTILGFTKRIN